MVKNPPANAGDIEDAGSIPVSGRSSGEGLGNPLQYSFFFFHSSILAWRIPRTEKPGGLQSIGSQRIRIAEQLSTHTCKIYTSSLCDDCGHAKTLRNKLCDFKRLFLAL